MRCRKILAVLLLGVSLGLSPLSAGADEYDPQDAGHPLRIVGYVLHPVGVVLDYVIFRPAHWIGSKDGMRELFGHKDAGHKDHHATK